jgi:hypothetical protein
VSLGAAAVIQKPIPRQALLASLTDLGLMRREGDGVAGPIVDEDPAHVA